MHDFCDGRAAAYPGSQGIHFLVPLKGAYVPVGQGEQDDDADEEENPTGHS